MSQPSQRDPSPTHQPIASRDMPQLAGKVLIPRELRLGGRNLALWLPSYDEQTLEGIIAQHGLNEKHWPYYLEDWPATFAMADFLVEGLGTGVEPASLRELRILDLGCGGGVLACFLWLHFGLEPYCLDFNPEACALTRFNLRRHGAQGQQVICADLFQSPLTHTFNLILGGEMLYAPALLPGVLAFLASHLAQGGEALFADARRGSAENFMPMARAAGFTVKRQVAGNAHVYVLLHDLGQARG